MLFGRNSSATLAAPEQATKSKVVILFLLSWFASTFHHLPGLVKKLLGNYWLMFSFIEFTAKIHYSIVKGIRENPFDFIQMKDSVSFISDIVFSKKVSNINIGINSSSKKFKSFPKIRKEFDNRSFVDMGVETPKGGT